MIGIRPNALKESKPHEYLIRFVFGGVCTAAAGLIAKRFGPAAGGLFLAFPAIFPASASLIESHEKRRKEGAGMKGDCRGREAAALDAMGASLGATALAAFAVVVWRLLEHYNAALVIGAATVAWVLVAVGIWSLRRRVVHGWRRRDGTHMQGASSGTAVSRR
jgi:hypothetical protein